MVVDEVIYQATKSDGARSFRHMIYAESRVADANKPAHLGSPSGDTVIVSTGLVDYLVATHPAPIKLIGDSGAEGGEVHPFGISWLIML